MALVSLLALAFGGALADKDWFIGHYATIIGPKLKANVLKQHPSDYFKNDQGVMVGDSGRNIWFDNFGDEGAGIPTLSVVTLLARVKPVFPGFQLADHRRLLRNMNAR